MILSFGQQFESQQGIFSSLQPNGCGAAADPDAETQRGAEAPRLHTDPEGGERRRGTAQLTTAFTGAETVPCRTGGRTRVNPAQAQVTAVGDVVLLQKRFSVLEGFAGMQVVTLRSPRGRGGPW